MVEQLSKNGKNFQNSLKYGGISYASKLYELSRASKLLTPKLNSEILLRIHMINLDKTLNVKPEIIKEKIQAIETLSDEK